MKNLTCNSCGTILQEGEAFCPKCGTKVETPRTDNTQESETHQETANAQANAICAFCGTELEPGEMFCPRCGEKVQQAATDASPAEDAAKTCLSCGTEISGDAVFCRNCGRRIDTPADASADDKLAAYNSQIDKKTKKKKKKLVWLFVILGVVLAAAAVGVLLYISWQPKSVILNKSAVTLEAGDSIILSCEVLPETARDKSVTWTTSDRSVATVSTNGRVSAVSKGFCTITATTENGKSDTCRVTVELSKYDKEVIGEWICTDVMDMDTYANYDPRDIGLRLYLTVNENHTFELEYTGEQYNGDWEYTNTNDFGNYVYDFDNSNCIYIADSNELWLYIGDSCWTFKPY